MEYTYMLEPMPGHGSTTTYDKEGDRADDKKTHDNDNHPSKRDHERGKADADDRQAERDEEE